MNERIVYRAGTRAYEYVSCDNHNVRSRDGVAVLLTLATPDACTLCAGAADRRLGTAFE